MAGHSHAANVKHRKDAQGLKKAKIFTQILRLVQVAVKNGGPDENHNPSLRLALEKARQYSLPKDKIKNAIDKASGNDKDSGNYEEVRYDGYGPNGSGIIVEALTDNRNRTASDVRSIFTKYSGNLGETGSLSFIFKRFGVIYYKKSLDFDALFEAAVDVGAENAQDIGDHAYDIDLFVLRRTLERVATAAGWGGVLVYCHRSVCYRSSHGLLHR